MRHARIYPWRRTRRFRAPSNGPEAFFVAQFSAGYTTNMFGFDLRQGQLSRRLISITISLCPVPKGCPIFYFLCPEGVSRLNFARLSPLTRPKNRRLNQWVSEP